jgi:3-phenylpropionate/trans-cinnamate dioxygenase ferredoxin reductase component
VHVVVVGAGLAGARTAEGLRGAGHDGPISLVGKEPHLPYDRPPLSKEVLSGRQVPEATWLADRGAWRALDVTLRLGTAVASVDTAARTVSLANGHSLGYDQLVVASGVTARRLPEAERLAGVHSLRTVDDVRALRAELVPGCRVVVVGGGVLGCESAATLATAGFHVDLVEALPGPMWTQFGGHGAVEDRVCSWHREHGVIVHMGRSVARWRSVCGRATGVELDTGTVLPGEVFVVAVGSTPATAWLAGSGIDTTDGVLCDEYGAAVGVAGVWAVGDVARFRHRRGTTRLEHWTNAVETARQVSENIVAAESARKSVRLVPATYFWSNQYGRTIQAIGLPGTHDEAEVLFDDINTEKLLVVYGHDGKLAGAVGIHSPRELARARALLNSDAEFSHAVGVLAPQPTS